MAGQRSGALQEMGHAIPLGEPVDRALGLIVERARALTGASEAVALVLHDDCLIAHAASGVAVSAVADIPLSADDSLEAWVARCNAPVFVPDVTREPRLLSSILPQHTLTSVAAVPLRTGATVAGVLEVRAVQAADFVTHAPLLLAMAEIAALTFETTPPSQHSWSVAAPGFIRAITHDLKSPLTAIRGHAQLLQRRAMRGGAQADVDTAVTIVEQVQRMAGMLDALADAGLAEEGNLVLSLTRVNLVALVNGIVDALRATVPGQTLRVTAAEPELPVEADEARLSRVIHTLVGNASRRSAANGYVEVTLVRQGPEIVVTVHDEDASKAPADLPHIFDWAYQSAHEPRGAFDLALYSGQRIIETHRGRLWANSAPGAGTTFAFTLPAATV